MGLKPGGAKLDRSQEKEESNQDFAVIFVETCNLEAYDVINYAPPGFIAADGNSDSLASKTAFQPVPAAK